jgi:hypothetical protein
MHQPGREQKRINSRDQHAGYAAHSWTWNISGIANSQRTSMRRRLYLSGLKSIAGFVVIRVWLLPFAFIV